MAKTKTKNKKKTKKKKKSAKTPQKKGGLFKYFKEVKQEAKRVSWPTRQQVVQSTLLVLAVVLFFALYVGILDVIFIRLVKYLTFSF